MKSGKKVLFEGAQGDFVGHLPWDLSFRDKLFHFGGSACIEQVLAHDDFKSDWNHQSLHNSCGFRPIPNRAFWMMWVQNSKDGHEFGSTTGRARRCGLLDLVALKYAISFEWYYELSFDEVRCGHDQIGICTAYKLNGETLTEFPTSAHGFGT